MQEKRHILADDYEFIIPKKGLNLIQSLYEFEYQRLSSSGKEALDELADLINKANNFK